MIRSLVSDPTALDEFLERYPVVEGGAVNPRLVQALVDAGHLEMPRLINEVSELPVEPELAVPRSERYETLAPIGAGAMGVVELVHDQYLGRYIARKSLDEDKGPSKLDRERFRHEAVITAQLDHPGIVAIHDLVEEGSRRTYTMKLVHGRTLASLLTEARACAVESRRMPGFSLSDRLVILLDVCDALAHAHARGILHRDLKPDNIMVGRFGQMQLMDWGLARRMGGAELRLDPDRDVEPAHHDSDARRTAAGTAMGTPLYMSPEQAWGENEALDGRSDLYALGLILFELLTLQRARKGKRTLAVLLQAQAGTLQPLEHLVAKREVPKGLAAIVKRSTERHRDDRYDSVQDFAEDIRRYLRDEPLEALPDTLLSSLGRWIARHRTATLGVLFSLILGVVGLGFLGIAGAVGVNELNRRAAEAREARLDAARAQVIEQANAIRRELHRLEGLARAAAGATVQAYRAPAPDVRVYETRAFAPGAEDPPADLVQGAPWDGPVSFEQVDIVRAPDVSPSEEELRRVASLAPAYRRALLGSWGDELRGRPWPEVRDHLLERGAPLIWVYAGTESGLGIGFPGTDSTGLPADYDPRTRPWYRTAIDSEGPVWSALDADESGLGLLLTCGLALRDDEGSPLGVMAVDVTFGYVIDRFLEPADLAEGAEAWLIDREGRVVVRSSQAEFARKVPDDWVPPPFPHPELFERMQRTSTGAVELELEGVDSLVVWHRLDEVGWTYLVTGMAMPDTQ